VVSVGKGGGGALSQACSLRSAATAERRVLSECQTLDKTLVDPGPGCGCCGVALGPAGPGPPTRELRERLPLAALSPARRALAHTRPPHHTHTRIIIDEDAV
jgi:hypothetical protein